jgi:hypothetical protein
MFTRSWEIKKLMEALNNADLYLEGIWYESLPGWRLLRVFMAYPRPYRQIAGVISQAMTDSFYIFSNNLSLNISSGTV